MKPYFERSIKPEEEIMDFYYKTKEETLSKNKPCIVLYKGKCVGVIHHLPEQDSQDALEFFDNFWTMQKKG